MVNQSGLTWMFSTRSPQATFLDMTVSIESGRLITKLFKKPGALQLFIPPRSCHPPGVITGLIMGNILWIFRLCSQAQDITKELNAFFEAILARGYQVSTIKPIFEKAISNAKNYIKYPMKYQEQKKLKKPNYLQNNVSSSTSLSTQTTLPHESFKTFGTQKFIIHQVNCLLINSPTGRAKLSPPTNWSSCTAELQTSVTFYPTKKLMDDRGQKCHPIWLDTSRPLLFCKLWQALPLASLPEACKIK